MKNAFPFIPLFAVLALCVAVGVVTSPAADGDLSGAPGTTTPEGTAPVDLPSGDLSGGFGGSSGFGGAIELTEVTSGSEGALPEVIQTPPARNIPKADAKSDDPLTVSLAASQQLAAAPLSAGELASKRLVAQQELFATLNLMLPKLQSRRAFLGRRTKTRRSVFQKTGANPKWIDFCLELIALEPAENEEMSPSDLAKLREHNKKLAAPGIGLATIEVGQIRWLLQRYLNLVDATQDDSQSEAPYDQITYAIDVLRGASSAQYAANLSDLLFKQDFAKKGPLVRAVKKAFSRPNIYFDVKASTFSTFLNRSVEERDVRQRNVVAGMSNNTRSNITGEVEATLVPYKGAIVFDLNFSAVGDSASVGKKGRAKVRTSSTSRIAAMKRCWFDLEGAKSHPTSTDAKMETEIKGMTLGRGHLQRGPLFGPLVSNMMRQQVNKQKAEAKAAGERMVAKSIGEKFDAEVDPMLQDINKNLDDPDGMFSLIRCGATSSKADFVTTQKGVHAELWQADPWQLAASNQPPKLKTDPAFALRFHQSVFNNVAARLFARQRINCRELHALVEQWLGVSNASEDETDSQPGDGWGNGFGGGTDDEVKPQEDKEAVVKLNTGSERDTSSPPELEILFSKERPLLLDIQKNKATIQFRADTFYVGEKVYPGLCFQITYHLSEYEGGYYLTFDQDVPPVIFRPGSKPGERLRFTSSHSAVKTMLQKELPNRFPHELGPIQETDIFFSGKSAVLGVENFVLDKGWITLEFSLRNVKMIETE